MKKSILYNFLLAAILLGVSACQKYDRPKLGDYPTDDRALPAGDLRFFVPFGGASANAAENMKDSISGNPSYRNELKLTTGINDKALQGADGIAVKYLNANDMKNATSFTIAFWVKRALNDRTEFYFGMTGDPKDYWHQSPMFMLVEKGKPNGNATIKFAVDDKWFEFSDSDQFPKPLLDNQWHHLAMAYDETMSKLKWYFDGILVENAPASATSALSGPLKIKSAGKMILGGWNKHASLPGVTDDWVKSFEGAMDQFRMYKKALSASDILALYNSKL